MFVLLQIFKEQYEDEDSPVSGMFTIDQTIGRDVNIQIDYVSEEEEPIKAINLIHPDGTSEPQTFTHDRSKLVVIQKESLEVKKSHVKFNGFF